MRYLQFVNFVLLANKSEKLHDFIGKFLPFTINMLLSYDLDVQLPRSRTVDMFEMVTPVYESQKNRDILYYRETVLHCKFLIVLKQQQDSFLQQIGHKLPRPVLPFKNY